MKISKIIETLSNKATQYNRAHHEAICEFIKGLVPLLTTLTDFVFSPDDKKTYVHLRYMKKGVAIRYCGRFFNTIVIGSGCDRGNADDALHAVSLSYVVDTDDEQLYRHDSDGYLDLDCQDFPLDGYNIEEMLDMGRSLSYFFTGTSAEAEYSRLYRQLADDTAAFRKDCSKDEPTGYEPENDMIFYTFFEAIQNHPSFFQKENTDMMHVVKLPFGLSIRFAGYFHNCLVVTRDFRLGLGYMKTLSTGGTSESIDDLYTGLRDILKVESSEPQNIRYLEVPENDEWSVINALRALKGMLGDGLEHLPEQKYSFII